jgi:hypothetical protein
MSATRVEGKAERDARVVSMRGVGCSVLDIAETLGVSPSTVDRVLKRHKTHKGELVDALVSKSRDEVLSTLTGNQQLTTLAAISVRTSMLINERIQQQVLQAIELIPTDPSRGLLMARALNSLSNTMKLCNDSVRSAIKIAPPSEQLADVELPELMICSYTDSELEKIVEMGEALYIEGDPTSCEDDVPELEFDPV